MDYIPPVITYCVVHINETSNTTWNNVMLNVIEQVGTIPNKDCSSVYIPLCYGNKRNFGDVIYPSISTVTREPSLFRFVLQNDETYVTTYNLNGIKTTSGKPGNELHNIAKQQLKALEDLVNPCNNNLPDFINVPL